MSATATTFWRIAGLSYVQMAAISTTTVRSAMKVRCVTFLLPFSLVAAWKKTLSHRLFVFPICSLPPPLSQEPMKSAALSRDAVFYNRATFQAGVQSAKTPISSLAEAAAKL